MEFSIQSELLTRAQETLVMLETIREGIIMEDNKDKLAVVKDCQPSSFLYNP